MNNTDPTPAQEFGRKMTEAKRKYKEAQEILQNPDSIRPEGFRCSEGLLIADVNEQGGLMFLRSAALYPEDTERFAEWFREVFVNNTTKTARHEIEEAVDCLRDVLDKHGYVLSCHDAEFSVPILDKDQELAAEIVGEGHIQWVEDR